MRFLSLSLMAALMTGTAALAQQAPAPQQMPPMEDMRAQLEEQVSQSFAQMDADDDGVLTADEMVAESLKSMEERLRAQIEDTITRYDVDSSGDLTEQEAVDGAMRDLENRGGVMPRPGGAQ